MSADDNEKCPATLSADYLCKARRRLKRGSNDDKGAVNPLLYLIGESIDNLDFFIVNSDYASYLQEAESAVRGFSRIPNMDYGLARKQKFLCGVVLKINYMDYYVPVTSYKVKRPDNFLIYADNGAVVSSLRFNYMFPVPIDAIARRIIDTEPDIKYKALLAQELRYCIKNQDEIRHLAERTYKRVLLGKDPGLVVNSCDFMLLESKCNEWIANH